MNFVAKQMHLAAYFQIALGALGFFLLVEFAKTLPFAYHVRVISLLLWHTLSIVLNKGGFVEPSDASKTKHIVRLGDLDWNLHQNNSIYPLESDVSRYSFLVGLIAGRNPFLFPLWNLGWKVALGGITSYFIKEMRWHQQYTITNKLIGCDAKWLFLGIYFEHNGKIFAVQVARIVFKERSGKTLPPRAMMEAVGYSKESIDRLEWLGDPALPTAGSSTPMEEALKRVGPTLGRIVDILVPTLPSSPISKKKE